MRDCDQCEEMRFILANIVDAAFSGCECGSPDAPYCHVIAGPELLGLLHMARRLLTQSTSKT